MDEQFTEISRYLRTQPRRVRVYACNTHTHTHVARVHTQTRTHVARAHTVRRAHVHLARAPGVLIHGHEEALLHSGDDTRGRERRQQEGADEDPLAHASCVHVASRWGLQPRVREVLDRSSRVD